MALHPFRLRRALSLSFSLLHRSLPGTKPIFPDLPSTSCPTRTPIPFSTQLSTRLFTSTTTVFRKTFDPETDEIGPDTILFEGCDYNHWLITMDFPKDSNITREQMIETYVNTAAQVLGSVEEAKKKIYALSTTTYQGFQVECTEETSEKFKSLPGVVFVLPDSYIDPVNKEYGGDKYVNGEIFPRPPPVYYSRRSNRDRRPREQNYGPPPQQNQGPASQQNYGPRPQQNYGPPPQQNYGQRPQHSYGPPPPQNYGPPPSQNYGPPPPQNYGPPPSQNYGPPPPQNYGPPPSQNYGPPPSQNYGPPSSQNYGPPLSQTYGPPPSQTYGPPPSQTYGQPPSQTYGPTQHNIAPHPQQNYTPYPQQNFAPPKQGTASQPPQGYGSPPEQSFVPKTQQNYGNSPNFPPQENYNSAGPGERSGSMLPTEASGNGERTSISSYHGNFNQPELGNLYAQGQRNSEGHADNGSSQGGSFEQVSGAQRNFSSEWK